MLAYVKCMVLTCLGSYPFLVPVTTGLQNSAFEACTDAPCVFISFFGAPGLPASTRANLRSSANITAQPSSWLNMLSLPLYVSVQNGLGLQAVGAHLSFIEASPLLHMAIPSLISSRVSSAGHGEFPSNKHATSEYCERQSTRDGIQNHLQEGYSRMVYVCCILLWTGLKIIHDWAVLCGLDERVTIRIGWASWIFQALACVSIFLWAAGAVQVFISTSGERTKGLACYYQLKDASALVILFTPFLLLYTTEAKLQSLYRSQIVGDYLYAVMYDVPFRIASAVNPSNPAGSLLAVGYSGDPDRPYAAQPQPMASESALTLRVFAQCRIWTTLGFLRRWIWTFAVNCVLATISSGPLFRRLVGVALMQEWGADVFGAVKLATLLATLAAPAMAIAYVYASPFQVVKDSSRQNELPCLALCCCCPFCPLFWRFWLGLSSFYSAGCICAAFWSPPIDIPSHSWTWASHGIPLLVFTYASAQNFAQLERQRLLEQAHKPEYSRLPLSQYDTSTDSSDSSSLEQECIIRVSPRM